MNEKHKVRFDADDER